MTKAVDPTTLDAKTRRLAERGAREAFGVSLDQLLYVRPLHRGRDFREDRP